MSSFFFILQTKYYVMHHVKGTDSVDYKFCLGKFKTRFYMLKLINRIQMGGSDFLGCGGTDGATYLDTDLEISLNNFIALLK